MDQQIQERLRVFQAEGLATPATVDFMREVLLWIEQTTGHETTEETAGPLASHLMLALERVRLGEGLGDAWDENVHREAASLPGLVPWANHVRFEAQRTLGLSLPQEETDFLLLHLGTFLLKYDDTERLTSTGSSGSTSPGESGGPGPPEHAATIDSQYEEG